MFQRKFLLALVLPALMSSTALAQAQTSHREYDEIAWKEMRAATSATRCGGFCEPLDSRLQRPGLPVRAPRTSAWPSSTLQNIDTSGCSHAVKMHLKNADRINTEIGETFALGLPDIKMVLLQAPSGAGGSGNGHISLETKGAAGSWNRCAEMAKFEKRLIAELGFEGVTTALMPCPRR